VVKLEVLLLGGCVYSPHGPDGLSATYKKSLREIADLKEPKSAPADGWECALECNWLVGQQDALVISRMDSYKGPVR